MHAAELAKLQRRLQDLPPIDLAASYALLRDVTVFARLAFGEKSAHLVSLNCVSFEHPEIVYNSGHYKIKEHWESGLGRLRSILQAMEYEISLTAQRNASLEPPAQVTIQWLLKHVPLSLWAAAAALLLSVLLAGYVAGSSQVVQQVYKLLRGAFAGA